MAIRTVSRATHPHLPALNDALRPLLAAANAGGFETTYRDGAVVIEQASFTGVDWAAVAAAVAAAPSKTALVEAQREIDEMSPVLRALVTRLVKYINIERNRHSIGPITEATFLSDAKGDLVAILTP